MIKDVAAKLLLIPLLGLLIPAATSIFVCNECSFYQIGACVVFYIGITFLFWQGIVAITAAIRNHPRIRNQIGLKVLLLILCAGLFAFLLISLFAFALKTFFPVLTSSKSMAGYIVSYFAIAPVIGLTYEILFLQKEQELDSRVVAQLDYERQSAELNVLKAELDPHFIFNALNSLTPLITTDAAKAHIFTSKLAQTYKYLLLKRSQELITVTEELRFIEEYCFLLQIRHENQLKLHIVLNGMAPDKIMILPFALQLLLENAIKHNNFSEAKPLVITVTLNKQFLQVSNTVHPKPYAVESTHVGLKNLSARYKLTCNKDITITHTQHLFVVKLPLIKPTI